MKKLLFLLSLVVGMASCSNEDLELADNAIQEQNQQASFKVSPEEAKTELGDFLEQFKLIGYKNEEYRATGNRGCVSHS